MADDQIYRVSFLKHGKVYEMYCRNVSTSDLWGFVDLSGLVFGDTDAVVVDPTEEKMRDEFEGVEALYLPMHSVLSIAQVKKRGKAVIRDRESGEKVTPFPLSPPSRSKN
ncbi:MAG: hypothetical protein ACI9H8_000836 [Lysobacterales bacterium]|jgi:hypothetical protein